MIESHGLGQLRIVPALLLSALVFTLLPAALVAQPASAQEAVDLYGSAWGEPDEAKRRAILEKAWAEDGVVSNLVNAIIIEEGACVTRGERTSAIDTNRVRCRQRRAHKVKRPVCGVSVVSYRSYRAHVY